MFFNSFSKKKVKELRKNQRLTAKELAERVKVETIEIMKIDDICLRDVSEPLKSKITPILKGVDPARWL